MPITMDEEVTKAYEAVKEFLLDPFALLSQKQINQTCAQLIVSDDYKVAEFWRNVEPAKCWCALNRIKTDEAKAEMQAIESTIGLEACTREWRHGKWGYRLPQGEATKESIA